MTVASTEGRRQAVRASVLSVRKAILVSVSESPEVSSELVFWC